MTAGPRPIVPCYWQWMLALRYPIWVVFHGHPPSQRLSKVSFSIKGLIEERNVNLFEICNIVNCRSFYHLLFWERNGLKVTLFTAVSAGCIFSICFFLLAVDSAKSIFARTFVGCRFPSPINQHQPNGKQGWRRDFLGCGPSSPFLPQTSDSFVLPVRAKSALAWRRSGSVASKTATIIRSRKRL